MEGFCFLIVLVTYIRLVQHLRLMGVAEVTLRAPGRLDFGRRRFTEFLRREDESQDTRDYLPLVPLACCIERSSGYRVLLSALC